MTAIRNAVALCGIAAAVVAIQGMVLSLVPDPPPSGSPGQLHPLTHVAR